MNTEYVNDITDSELGQDKTEMCYYLLTRIIFLLSVSFYSLFIIVIVVDVVVSFCVVIGVGG